jgi:type VI protein secretion system component VasK
MKKWLYRIVWIPVLVIAVLFLVANRQPVAISLDPFSADNPVVTTVALPLWLWLVFTMFLGVGLGAVGMWSSGAEKRRKARHEHRELKTLRREMAAARKRASQSHEAETEVAETKPGGNEPPLLESVSAS